ncbi:DUF3800 domain-containing protein [Streptomyces sp. OE57]|uniref:DUF3800 domain-containing protein n=1 Tax=Streptomyces lacaronensis TaxID=3379885 RepID=UPI0039B78523
MTPAPTVYADESNSTGENLLDDTQPVFCVAAVHVSDARAKQIVDSVRTRLPAGQGEPKYTSLSKADAGREALVTAFSALADEHVRTYVAHKRFMATTKVVDALVVERFWRSSGYNMYADGSAVALANLFHMAGPVVGDASAYEHLLQTFVDAIRRRSRASVDDLFAAITAYLMTVKPDFLDTFAPLEFTRAEAEDIVASIANGEVEDVLDPAIPCLVSLCQDMGQRIGVFHLVHDDSKTIARHASRVENLHEVPDLARPGQMMASSSVTAITFSGSTTAPQLQIADWIAGAARQWASSLVTERPDPYAKRLEPIVAPWVAGGIWPDRESIATPRLPA